MTLPKVYRPEDKQQTESFAITLRSEFIRQTYSLAEKKINIRKIVNFIEGDPAG